jgi:hypothetical protein
MQELQRMEMPAGGGLDRPRPKLGCSAIKGKELRNCLLHIKLLIVSHRTLRFYYEFVGNMIQAAKSDIYVQS